jgi:DNA-binding CsgD family transcriptional regulator
MLVVSASAQVAHLNLAAERMVAAGDGLTLVHNVLGAVNPRDDVGLRQLIASAVRATREIAAAPGEVMRIARRSGRAPYEVLVAPLAHGKTGAGPNFPSPRAAIFVRDPETQAASPLDWLQRLYGLTAAEARLMQALLGGDTLETIAERIGVAKGTLRTQLKAIFAKTGTSRQAELVRLGLRGLAAFAR